MQQATQKNRFARIWHSCPYIVAVLMPMVVGSRSIRADAPYFIGTGMAIVEMTPDAHYFVGARLTRGTGRDSDDYDVVRWELGGQLEELGFAGRPNGITDDGSVIVGSSGSLFASQTFRWTAAEGAEYIAPGLDSHPITLSGDGKSVIVGEQDKANVWHRWTTAEGLQSFPTIPGAQTTQLFGWSDRFSTTLGVGTFQENSDVSKRVFRWTEEADMWTPEPGMSSLVTPPPGYNEVGLGPMTADLSVAGGWVSAQQFIQVPARWTAETGWVPLPDLEGGDTYLNGPVSTAGISADGSILVGRGVDPSGPEPFIWDAVRGTRNLTAVLRDEYGLASSLNGWNLTSAAQISDDGRTILGLGRNPSGQNEMWLAYLGDLNAPNAWRLDSNGNWVWAPHWTSRIPNNAGANALFGNVISQPRTITLNLPVSLGRLQFDNANTYTISGSNRLTLDVTTGDATINIHSGNHIISAPVTLADNTLVTITPAVGSLSITGPLTATGINITKAGAGTLTVNNVRAAGLAVNSGTVAIAPNPSAPALSTSVLGTLSIAGDTNPTAKLDLNNNAAIIDYTGASPVATVRQQILAGRGGEGFGNTWNGQGITSSAAASANAVEPESRSIGYAENSSLPLGPYTTFRGQPVDDTSLLIAYTRTGDANLDGIVNDEDVTIVSATYAPGVPQPFWALGDFDYNGFVDDDDVTLLGAFFDPSAPPLAAFDTGHAAVAAVPEPSTWTLAGASIVALRIVARRRRHALEMRFADEVRIQVI